MQKDNRFGCNPSLGPSLSCAFGVFKKKTKQLTVEGRLKTKIFQKFPFYFMINFLRTRIDADACTLLLIYWPAKSHSDGMFCLQSYQGLIIDISLLYLYYPQDRINTQVIYRFAFAQVKCTR